ncbi:MAG: PAS domain S-box protein [Actinomycetia bacterium]|nr:PAS domain S-box protein [Actinomycetes bacterium]
MTALQVFTISLYFLAFVLYVLLGSYIIYKNPAALVNRLCALAIASFAIWALGDVFFRPMASPSPSMLWQNIASVGWCSFPATVFWFYLALTGHERVARNPLAIIAGVAIVAFFISQQWRGSLVSGFAIAPFGWVHVWASGYIPILFYVYYFVLVLGCFYLVVRYGSRSQSLRRKRQARLLTVTPLVCLALGSVTDVVLPRLHVTLLPSLAVVFVLLWGAALARAITRYGLMSLTPAAAAENILSTMNDLLVLVDTQGKIVHANRAALALLGYQEEELRDKELSSIVSWPGSATPLSFPELLNGGAVHNQELTMSTNGGAPLPVLLSTSVMKTEEGEPVGVVTVAHDIRDYQEIQRALRESEQKYRSLVDHALVGIGIHQGGKVVFANAELASLLGYTVEESLGLPIADRIHPDDRNLVMARARRRQAGSTEPETYEIRLLRKDGSAVHALISNAVIEYEGRPATLMTIADLTDSKTRVELEQTNKELESFSYSVSHDLRAPLRSIDGFSQALVEDYGDTLDAQARDYLYRVRAASQHMAQLIDDLLMLSRVTRAEMWCEPVDLTTVAETIAADLKATEPGRSVDFTIAEGVSAQGDAALLEIVLQNLLSNAWKFTAKHPRATIEFGVAEHGARPVYFVRDDGAGFDMAYVGRLFAPFQRLHTSAEFGGTGVGLATVQRIIHRHGGDVWAEAQVEKGATFYFTLEP